MIGLHFSHHQVMGVLGLFGILILGARATPPSVPAKSWVALELSFSNRGSVQSVSLSISRDGVEFSSVAAGAYRAGGLRSSVAYGAADTKITCSVVGVFEPGHDAFLFPEPGTYWVRWDVGFQEAEVKPLSFTQFVTSTQPQEADTAFLRELAQWPVFTEMVGADWVEGIPSSEFREWVETAAASDFRVLMVLGEVLEAAGARDPSQASERLKSQRKGMIWADKLWSLSRECPDSSYAPYAAHFAGCVYLTSVGREVAQVKRERKIRDHGASEEEIQILVDVARHEEQYPKAIEALTFAAERADTYLKPRLLCMSAMAAGLVRDRTETSRRLDAALEAGGERGTVADMVERYRADWLRSLDD